MTTENKFENMTTAEEQQQMVAEARKMLKMAESELLPIASKAIASTKKSRSQLNAIPHSHARKAADDVFSLMRIVATYQSRVKLAKTLATDLVAKPSEASRLFPLLSLTWRSIGESIHEMRVSTDTLTTLYLAN